MNPSLNRSATHGAGEQLPDSASTVDPRGAGIGLVFGGALFVTTYVLEIVFGLQQGRMYTPDDVPVSLLARSGLITFSCALLATGIGLFSLGWNIRSRARIAAVVAMILASVSFVLTPVNLALLSGLFGPPSHDGGLTLPILTNLAATIVLAASILRLRLLSPGIGRALLAAGIVTFPFILLTIPLESMLPDYIIADLPFAAWGAVLLIVGQLILRRSAKESHS